MGIANYGYDWPEKGDARDTCRKAPASSRLS